MQVGVDVVAPVRVRWVLSPVIVSCLKVMTSCMSNFVQARQHKVSEVPSRDAAAAVPLHRPPPHTSALSRWHADMRTGAPCQFEGLVLGGACEFKPASISVGRQRGSKFDSSSTQSIAPNCDRNVCSSGCSLGRNVASNNGANIFTINS